MNTPERHPHFALSLKITGSSIFLIGFFSAISLMLVEPNLPEYLFISLTLVLVGNLLMIAAGNRRSFRKAMRIGLGVQVTFTVLFALLAVYFDSDLGIPYKYSLATILTVWILWLFSGLWVWLAGIVGDFLEYRWIFWQSYKQ
jgi:hypothetical protein